MKTTGAILFLAAFAIGCGEVDSAGTGAAGSGGTAALGGTGGDGTGGAGGSSGSAGSGAGVGTPGAAGSSGGTGIAAGGSVGTGGSGGAAVEARGGTTGAGNTTGQAGTTGSGNSTGSGGRGGTTGSGNTTGTGNSTGAGGADGSACPGAGQKLCGNTCVDTTSNTSHCGACNNICPSGFTCTEGICTSSPSGTTSCGFSPNRVGCYQTAGVITSRDGYHCFHCDVASECWFPDYKGTGSQAVADRGLCVLSCDSCN